MVLLELELRALHLLYHLSHMGSLFVFYIIRAIAKVLIHFN
jgi:hypothetical protein